MALLVKGARQNPVIDSHRDLKIDSIKISQHSENNVA